MTQDLSLVADSNGLYDIQISGADFARDDGLKTSIEVSILTDARAENVNDVGSRRGYIGDALIAAIGRALGSTVWTYEQARLTQSTLNGVRAATNTALQWMVEDGIARSITPTVSNPSIGVIEINVQIITNAGDIQQYEVLWRQTV